MGVGGNERVFLREASVLWPFIFCGCMTFDIGCFGGAGVIGGAVVALRRRV